MEQKKRREGRQWDYRKEDGNPCPLEIIANKKECQKKRREIGDVKYFIIFPIFQKKKLHSKFKYNLIINSLHAYISFHIKPKPELGHIFKP